MPPKKKKLSKTKVAEVKKKVKKDVEEKAKTEVKSTRSGRLVRQNSLSAFGTLARLEAPEYELFADPVGAKTSGARGCKSARVVLGPLVGWPEPQPGTDAKSIYPDCIKDVRLQLNDAKNHWKSGHVINADFGGYGGSNQNMTCLTSSANTSQTAFDNNVKKARSALHKVYSDIRQYGKVQAASFFEDLNYGIEVKIEMSDDAWGDDYPENCVSNSMTLQATVLNEPAEDAVRDAMDGALGSKIQGVLNKIAEVQQHVDEANQRHLIDNTE